MTLSPPLPSKSPHSLLPFPTKLFIFPSGEEETRPPLFFLFPSNVKEVVCSPFPFLEEVLAILSFFPEQRALRFPRCRTKGFPFLSVDVPLTPPPSEGLSASPPRRQLPENGTSVLFSYEAPVQRLSFFFPRASKRRRSTLLVSLPRRR